MVSLSLSLCCIRTGGWERTISITRDKSLMPAARLFGIYFWTIYEFTFARQKSQALPVFMLTPQHLWSVCWRIQIQTTK
jgi:hypothetical protein